VVSPAELRDAIAVGSEEDAQLASEDRKRLVAKENQLRSILMTQKLIPPGIRGPLKFHLKPQAADFLGGPFNGQCFRQFIFIELLNISKFSAIVETGTYRGSTTLFMAKNTTLPIYTVEFDPEHFAFAKYRLREYSRVSIKRGDSRSFLKSLSFKADDRLFFYLDAHWREDLPLAEEVDYIVNRFCSFVIMIDDFLVPGDAGYSYDDYGPGKQLSLRDFPFHKNSKVNCYFPGCPSQLESGTKRGCIVLASDDMRKDLESVTSLSLMS